MFSIAGTQVAEPAHKGVTITDEPVWADNTGRTQTGIMAGDIVAWKRTVAVTWPPLSFDESQKIRRLIRANSPFFTISFNDVAINGTWPTYEDGQYKGQPIPTTTTSMTVYCGNIPRTLYSIADALARHQGVTITFVEQ